MNERFTPEEKKELQETLARIYKSTPYFQTLPCRVIDFDRGEVRIDFPIEERFCTADGTASAGLLRYTHGIFQPNLRLPHNHSGN